MDEIKLIIWDLDDTLWQGTLAENESVCLNQEVLKRIEFLLDRGIVHSLCSKNNEHQAQKLLKKMGISELFIFPQIAFENKGLMIKKLIKQAQFRPHNVLFVDDNDFNLREVAYHNPNLRVQLTQEFMQEDVSQWGKEDLMRQRFAQYKILEKKEKNKSLFLKNSQDEHAFLKECQISIQVTPLTIHDPDIERVIELVNRANQMNFTESRIEYEYLFTLFELKNGINFKIRVTDKYGDYGIVGYIGVVRDTLIHFVFSCRILGMEVESRLFQWLHSRYPKLKYSFRGSNLKNARAKLDFIEVVLKAKQQKNRPKDKKILLRGPCLANAISFLLNEHYQVDEEIFSFFEYANLTFLKNNLNSELVPRLNKTLKALNHNEYHIIVNFLESDYYSGYYKIKNQHIPIASNYIFWKSLLRLKKENQLLDEHIKALMVKGMRDLKKFNLEEHRFSPWPLMEKFAKTSLEWFGVGWRKLFYRLFFYGIFKNYQGYISAAEFEETLTWYINLFPEQVQLIFINPPEKIILPLMNESEGKKIAQRTETFNGIMRNLAKNKSNMFLLEMDEIIEQEDIIDSFSHLKRQGYIKLSQSLLSKVDSCLSTKLYQK